MTARKDYERQVELLIRVLPHIAKESCFAIKGGTALNLFVRELPRLSVDIDLTYLELAPREQTLLEIDAALKRIKQNVIKSISGADVSETFTHPEKHISKLLVSALKTQIKIEPNFIVRGTVYPVMSSNLCKAASNHFKMDVSDVKILSVADLYAGKFCAALNRQHPRDLFDVKLLLEHEGITPEICKAFVVYLASDKRPMHELLSPNIKTDQQTIFENEFKNMVVTDILYSELTPVLPKLIKLLTTKITNNEKKFLLSIAKGEPNWMVLEIPHLSQMPALNWKVQNVKKMDDEKRRQMIHVLEKTLDLSA